MARGDMAVRRKSFSDTEILNRKEFEAVAMTINSENPVKAGTPIKADGKPVVGTDYEGTAGILLHDVTPENPQGAILKKGYIHCDRANAHCNVAYDNSALVEALLKAGCRIVFEEMTAK